MPNQIIGTILAVSDQVTMQSKSGNTFTKQSVFLDNGSYDPETGEKRENNLLLDFINSKAGDLKQQFQNGQRVQVNFRLRGYSYQKDGKTEHGISVSCYRIEPYTPPQNGQPVPAAPQPTQIPTAQQSVQQPQTQAQAETRDEDDGLPF